MAQNLVDLEQDWLAAESIVDRLRAEAMQANAELKACNGEAAAHNDNEITVLLTKVETLQAKHEEADRAAREAFDRFWMAKDGD